VEEVIRMELGNGKKNTNPQKSKRKTDEYKIRNIKEQKEREKRRRVQENRDV
jgi:hypothetical protein